MPVAGLAPQTRGGRGLPGASDPLAHINGGGPEAASIIWAPRRAKTHQGLITPANIYQERLFIHSQNNVLYMFNVKLDLKLG